MKLLKKYRIMFATMVFLSALSISYGEGDVSAKTKLALTVVAVAPTISFTSGSTLLKKVDGINYYSGSAKTEVTSNARQNYTYQAAEVQIHTTGSTPMILNLNFCFSTENDCSHYFSPGNQKHKVTFMPGDKLVWYLAVETQKTIANIFVGNYSGTVTLTFTPDV